MKKENLQDSSTSTTGRKRRAATGNIFLKPVTCADRLKKEKAKENAKLRQRKRRTLMTDEQKIKANEKTNG